MSFTKSLLQPGFRIVPFYFWYGLYLLNELTINNKKLSNNLWDFLKCELFYIDGQCENTGYCCQKLKLTFFGRVIQKMDDFKTLLKKFPNYQSFLPTLKSNGNIKFFSCTHLTNLNLCSNYKFRPDICRNYPYSAFVVYDYIRQGCGYRVKKKEYPLSIRSKSLFKRIKKVCILNKLV